MPRMPPASALAVLSVLVAAPVPAQPPASPAGVPGAAVPPSGPARRARPRAGCARPGLRRLQNGRNAA